MGEVKAAFPPVIKKSVAFIAISMAIIDRNDMDNAVLKANSHRNFSLVLKIIVSKAIEVIKPAIIASTICHIMEVSG